MRTLQLYGLNLAYVALVDDEDYDRVSIHKWFAYSARGLMYAMRQTGTTRRGNKKVYYLHREVMNADPSQQVDHKDGDGLNCQKANLRFSTQQQNLVNRRRSAKVKSPYRGVTKQTLSPTFFARLTIHGRPQYLGSFSTPEEAATAYDVAAKQAFGEFAWLNFPEAD